MKKHGVFDKYFDIFFQFHITVCEWNDAAPVLQILFVYGGAIVCGRIIFGDAEKKDIFHLEIVRHNFAMFSLFFSVSRDRRESFLYVFYVYLSLFVYGFGDEAAIQRKLV